MNWDNYYDVLGVHSNATPTEIRRAYATKIKKYTNEQYPEEFMRIREAYEVLSNEQSRREYDEQLNYQHQYDELLNNARRYMNNGDYDSAWSVLRKLQALYPHDRVVQLEIAHLNQLMNADSSEETYTQTYEAQASTSTKDSGSNWGCCVCLIIIALVYFFNS